MKNLIVVIGGAGFVGTNLIKLLTTKTKFKIISLDNYSSGKKSNHVPSKKVKYINGHTKNINNILKKYKKKLIQYFILENFHKIYQSFINLDECINSNTIGTNEVFKFCVFNNIKLIYSAN